MRPLFYVARDNLINTIQYYNTATPEQQWTIACMPNAEMSHVLPKMTAVPSCDQMYFISTDCLPSTPCTKHCGTFQTTCCTFLQLAPRIYQICHLIDALLYWASVIIYGNGDILEEGVVGWVGRRRRRETEECSYCTAGMKMQS